MPTINFTEKSVFAANCPEDKKRKNYSDSKTPNLILEVYPSGTASYVFHYRDDRNRKSQLKIGNRLNTTLATARDIAQKWSNDLKYGIDPKEKKKQSNNSLTFKEFVDGYYIPHIKQYKKSWSTDVSLLKNHITPFIGNKEMGTIKPKDIIDYFQRHYDTHAASSTDRILILSRYIFNLAIKWDMNGSDKNPANSVPLLNQNNMVQRPLTEEEYPKLAEALKESPNKHLKYIIMLLLLTGARRGEILKACWKDIDLENRHWKIPMTKSGRPHTIYLSDNMIQILNEVGTKETSDFVFPSWTGKPYVSIFRSWDTVRKKAGLDDLRIHDLRHSFASALINQGQSLYAVQKLLGHTHVKTTQRYAHFKESTLSAATELAGNIYKPDFDTLNTANSIPLPKAG